MSNDGVGLRAVMRSVAFLTAGALAVPALAGCSSGDERSKPLADQDIAPAARDRVADGGTLHWAVDAVPETLNTFQADADATTTTVAQAVLPSMYRLDANGRPQVNPAYLESAKVVETEPEQVVLYKLNQQAVWSDGREIGAADFAAQWRALSGKDSAYWTARNAGYDRIKKVERGANDLEVRVTFAQPYADWRSLFSPLYPKDVMGTPDSFNDSARKKLKVTAGPFRLKKVDRKDEEVVLDRNPRWWGHPAKLNEIVLRAVPRDERTAALAAGEIELAEIDPEALDRIGPAARAGAKAGSSPLAGPGGLPAHGSGSNLGAADALRSWAVAHGDDEEAADEELGAREKERKAVAAYRREQTALKGFEVRRSLEPVYTQLALNGASGPLADERVRRAVARAIDRKALAGVVLSPLGLPAVPVGSHLALSGQDAYADNSGALGGQDAKEARALLADAGWVPGGPVDKERKKGEKAAGTEGRKAGRDSDEDEGEDEGEKAGRDSGRGDRESENGDDGTYVVGEDDKSDDDKSDDKDPKDHREGRDGPHHLAQDGKQYANKLKQGGAPGAYAPKGTAAPAEAATKVLAKNGKALALRFVLPSGPGSRTLHTVAGRISSMLEKVGIRTEISKVSDESYFKDHIASGQYDLALYSWPASAFPATDARPIFAKPVPAADGSLNVEQNYTRVGTDQVDQLFDQALGTLDEGRSRSLIRKADSRIWAAAGSIPLYQRPQLTAVRKDVVNAGAFGFQTPLYEDMGFLRKGEKAPARPARD
ncbi:MULTISPECIES: ABC transporter family substrate-binding protein [unclassified Streptomyces]|uniref:ABC transporter family substrate-binding protein n=1 Tax=unclassified Streptomyces TaxID=2593676 RepID=UPI00247687DD|nr:MULTISPECIES: ABC transporter family substrate-binding protein [unclassified Streptomyces]MDH6452647.1 peptide/nickel transport system substrate-binding protein [Streptomyces sp. SAI-119]MDH6496798.1 peptide/nickel transport system substrate-binding protein [Streptomyces sp. SAI-149]